MFNLIFIIAFRFFVSVLYFNYSEKLHSALSITYFLKIEKIYAVHYFKVKLCDFIETTIMSFIISTIENQFNSKSMSIKNSEAFCNWFHDAFLTTHFLLRTSIVDASHCDAACEACVNPWKRFLPLIAIHGNEQVLLFIVFIFHTYKSRNEGNEETQFLFHSN